MPPVALMFAFGRMTGDPKQGRALRITMAVIFIVALAVILKVEAAGNPELTTLGVDPALGNIEGKDRRFGQAGAALFVDATTGTGTGESNAVLEFTMPLSGLIAMFNLLLGCIAPGGVGTGLYSLLLLVFIAAFIGALMIGRTPEYLGKKINARDMQFAMFALLLPPALVLVFAGAASVIQIALDSLGAGGPHGLSEIVYAYASSVADNGSAFAGLNANTPWWNVTTGLAMFFGRFAHAIPILAIAGSLAAKRKTIRSVGDSANRCVLFITFLLAVILIVTLLQYLPALALGPIAEHILAAAPVRGAKFEEYHTTACSPSICRFSLERRTQPARRPRASRARQPSRRPSPRLHSPSRRKCPRPSIGGADMDIVQWLNAIDLGQYDALFHEHEIDANVLPDLVEADLEKIGVPLGHRKRLMRAIAALSAGGTPPSAAKPASAQPSPSPPTSGAEAERRPITVMFCDLVGSTGLAARLDAEDWRNLVGAYLDEASAAVTGLGGHVLKKLGDGLMALFGYPHAQENDAERAVRAALAIQRALGELNARNAGRDAPQLVARIGLEFGQVVVDATGEVFGEAPNVAARVQAAAEPGTVLVTASVQRQTAGLFVVEDKGAHDLKGVPAPVALYRIVRASGGGRRGGARALTPLVGREDELALLTRRWSRALEGEGQFVQIVGEPGIGKSRLIEEFRAKLAETPHTWVEWAASQLLQNTPLHPLAEWGRLRFGGADATDEGRLADLENTLRLIGLDAAEYAPLLAPLVDIPLREDRRAKFPPEELRRRQLAAMTAWVLAGARSQPAVIAFEDLHWADPTSLDLMARLAERGAQSPLLVVATTRPEFRAPWAMRSHHGVVSLAPLDRAQVRRMVGEIASRHALSDEMIDGVGERTGGVPLFVEEVTRLLLERDAQGGAQAIPPTLQQSLAARLDRLGEAREVAQIGAVLGRDFSYRLLSDVSSSAAGFDEPRLQAALDRLTEADLLFVDGAPPTAAYRFKHALIQDAAYESLLKSRRQALHRRAAEALRDANAEPEAIAHHFTEAGLDDLAIEWWGKAGDQALRRSAFQEAIAHLGKAIAMADKAAASAPADVLPND